MFQPKAVLFLYTEQPLHAGSGSSLTAIDLPIQRERHSQLPMIQASGLKGTFRDATAECWTLGNNQSLADVLRRRRELKRDIRTTAARKSELSQNEQRTAEEAEVRKFETLFGPETDHAEDHAGAISLTDARLLLFPVRSLVGVFSYVTCPYLLERLRRDAHRMGHSVRGADLWQVDSNTALVRSEREDPPGDCEVLVDSTVVLEDFSIPANRSNDVTGLGKWLADNALPTDVTAYDYFRRILPNRLVVVDDTRFQDLTRHATEVVTRIKINDETGTVDRETGGLWNVENVPPETLFYSVASFAKPAGRTNGNGAANDGLMEKFEKACRTTIQLGGDQTIGRGVMGVRYLECHNSNSNTDKEINA